VEEREPIRGQLQYAVGAAMVLWYAPLIAALFLPPLAEARNGQTMWLRLFVILPGMLAKVLVDKQSDSVELAVAGAVSLLLLAAVAAAWLRFPRRRALIAWCTFAVSVTNAFILAPLFAL